MSELIETPIHELTETELDAVAGGFFDFGNTVTQSNAATVIGFNALTLGGGTVLQLVGQSNDSNI